ncbi:MAG: hypothetical protein NVS3B5_02170 [Sphingomicrobium sp.]
MQEGGMSRQRAAAAPIPRDKSNDKAFVVAALRAISRNIKSIDGVVEAAGVALSQGLISPFAAINMVNGVAPGVFENFLRDVETAEIGTGYSQEAAE